MNQEAEDVNDVMARIDEYLGTTPTRSEKDKEPVIAERTQAAKMNGSVLHVMFDVTRKEILGASLGGKVIAARPVNQHEQGRNFNPRFRRRRLARNHESCRRRQP